jgi:predicted enzyme related to lactoylglutathione lyase
MKKTLLGGAMVLAIAFTACQPSTQKTESTETKSTKETPKTITMNNLVSIIEIPVSDYDRAAKFYQNVLDMPIEKMEMDGNLMGVIPNEQGTVNVVLVKGPDYKPTSDGVVLYLNAGEDLQPMLDRVSANGGQVIVPKTIITEEMGYFAMFIDSEGNKMGLHSGK